MLCRQGTLSETDSMPQCKQTGRAEPSLCFPQLPVDNRPEKTKAKPEQSVHLRLREQQCSAPYTLRDSLPRPSIRPRNHLDRQHSFPEAFGQLRITTPVASPTARDARRRHCHHLCCRLVHPRVFLRLVDECYALISDKRRMAEHARGG